jgi:hypothetical protein
VVRSQRTTYTSTTAARPRRRSRWMDDRATIVLQTHPRGRSFYCRAQSTDPKHESWRPARIQAWGHRRRGGLNLGSDSVTVPSECHSEHLTEHIWGDLLQDSCSNLSIHLYQSCSSIIQLQIDYRALAHLLAPSSLN